MKVKMFSKFHFPHNTTAQLSNAVKTLYYVDEISPRGTCSILLMAFDTENNRQKETNCPNGTKMKTLFKKTAVQNLNFSRIGLHTTYLQMYSSRKTRKSPSVFSSTGQYTFLDLSLYMWSDKI